MGNFYWKFNLNKLFLYLLQKQLDEKDKELVTLNSTIKNLMLDKCGLSDRLRKVDIRLAEKEKQVVALEQKIEKSFESTESKENEPEDPMSPLGFQKVANNRSLQHISYNFF